MSEIYNIPEIECKCSIVRFYENAAIRAGYILPEDANSTKFDCSKIHVTEYIQDLLMEYYANELRINYGNKVTEDDIKHEVTMKFLAIGPKADLRNTISHAISKLSFSIDEGFITSELVVENKFSSEFTAMIKAAAREIEAHAEDYCNDSERLTDMDIWIRINHDSLPEIHVEKSYTVPFNSNKRK